MHNVCPHSEVRPADRSKRKARRPVRPSPSGFRPRPAIEGYQTDLNGLPFKVLLDCKSDIRSRSCYPERGQNGAFNGGRLRFYAF